jgi:hypothetical protein
VTLFYEPRERVLYNLLPQSPCPGGELLPLYHVSEVDDVDVVKGASGSGSDIVSPPILVVFILVSYVSCFSVAPSQNHQRGIYSRF